MKITNSTVRSCLYIEETTSHNSANSDVKHFAKSIGNYDQLF